MEFLSGLVTLFIFILLIGVLVFVHEFGHYVIARLIGAKVEEFALGFGPTLLKKKVGETDYMIKLLPLGGYVKILGETDTEKTDDPRSLKNKSPFKRILVMIAGVTMNLILAVILYYVVIASSGYKIYLSNSFADFKPYVGEVYLEKVGDSKQVTYVALAPEGNAKKAGMPEKGTIKSIEGKEINLSSEIPQILYENRGKVVEIFTCSFEGCSEGEGVLDLARYSVAVSDEGKIGISITPNFVTVLSYEKSKGVSGLMHGANILKISFAGMGDIFSRAKESGDYTQAVNTLSGPVGIFLAIDKIKEYGVMSLVSLAADLSLVLAVMNLLPIPALDGGRILLTIPELVTKKPINPKFEAILINISFLLLLILMLVVFVKDIVFFDYIKSLLG